MVKNSNLKSSGLSLEINSPRKKSPRSSRGTKDKDQDGSGSDSQERGTVGPKKGVKLPPNTPRKASTNRALLKLRGSVHTLQVLSRLSKYAQSAYYFSLYFNWFVIKLRSCPIQNFKKNQSFVFMQNIVQKIDTLHDQIFSCTQREGYYGDLSYRIPHFIFL